MTSSLKRIYSLLVQEAFITRHSLETFFDIFFFPLMNVILFGLITHFVAGVRESTNAQYLILGILLWEVVGINQYNVTVSTLWSVWSHNLTNIFISPVSIFEYMLAHITAALLKTLIVFVILSLATMAFFHFNVFHLGSLNLALYFINLSLFAWALGMMLLGLIFRYGTRIQAIAWGLIFLFQPLTASFFPVSVLAPALRAIAFALPPTYVFEAARHSLTTPGTPWLHMCIAFLLNIVYVLAAIAIFRFLFLRSRVTGQFARNDL